MIRATLALLLAFNLGFLVACGDDNGEQVEQGINNDVNNVNNAPDCAAFKCGEPPDDDVNNDVNNTPNNDVNNDDKALPPMPWDPREPGFYDVGYMAEELTYEPPASDQARTLRIVYWYPTLDDEGTDARYANLLPRPGVFEGASVAIDQAAPVLVFSHGSTSFAEQSYFMTEYFVSHGWVVVAMDHTGNTFNDRNGIPPEIFALRPQDITATIDHVQGLGADHPLAGLFGEDIILSGHSFGGYTTLAVAGASFQVDTVVAACEAGQLDRFLCDYFLDDEIVALFQAGFRDERVKLAIPQAPFGGPVFGPGVADIDIPVLLFTALGDRTLPPRQDGDPIWEGLDGEDDIRVDIVTAGHFTFSNACGLGLGIGVNDGCGPSFISPERAFTLVNTYSMVFARHHLFGEQDYNDILDGTTELSNDVRFYTH